MADALITPTQNSYDPESSIVKNLTSKKFGKRRGRFVRNTVMMLLLLLTALISAGTFYLYFNVYLKLPIIEETRTNVVSNNEWNLSPIAIPSVDGQKISRYLIFKLRLVMSSPEEKLRGEAIEALLRDTFFTTIFQKVSSVDDRKPINSFGLNQSLDSDLSRLLGKGSGQVFITGIYERPVG